jgi:uncharacterized protein YndB with AHSA1/START domain
VRFVERCEFSGDPGEVWARVSDIDAIPKYWHGTREIEVTREGGKTRADVVFAFGGKGSAEVTVDDANRTLILAYLRGPFKGTQAVTVKEGTVEAEWNVTFKGAYKVVGPFEASHFRSGTRNALKRLCAGPANGMA